METVVEKTEAHREAALEKSLGERARLQRGHGHGARRLADDRHFSRIAAEFVDVASNPLERRHLIEKAVVARGVMRRLRRQIRMRHIAERADPVVEADEDHAFLGDVFAAVHRHPAGAEREAAAVDPDDHGQAGAEFGVAARPDVQIQAVLAGRFFPEIMIEVVAAQNLNAFGGHAVGVIDALPGLDRLRLAPAQIASGCGRVGNPEIGLHAGRQDLARHGAAVDRDRIFLDRRLDDLTESGQPAEP